MNHRLEFSELLGKFGFILKFLMQSISEKRDERAHTTRAGSVANTATIHADMTGSPRDGRSYQATQGREWIIRLDADYAVRQKQWPARLSSRVMVHRSRVTI